MMDSLGLFMSKVLTVRQKKQDEDTTAGLTSLNRTSNRGSNETSIKERLRSGAREGFGVRKDEETWFTFSPLARMTARICSAD
jgi:hypothetical protein